MEVLSTPIRYRQDSASALAERTLAEPKAGEDFKTQDELSGI
jgi:hypothetical protein